SNAALALAAIAAARGYGLRLFMPDNTPESHQRLLQMHGAEILLIPAALGLAGAIEAARSEAESGSGCFLAQYSSIDTAGAHQHSTAEELWTQTGGRIGAIVAGIGTGGVLTGVGRLLKPRQPTLRVIGVEPAASRVLRGEPARPHALHGIGVGFRPESLNRSVLDEVIPVSDQAAQEWMARVVRSEGLALGLASAAALKAAFDFAGRPENAAKTIVVMLTATAERDLIPFKTYTG
ncbi:MAG: pyridoxal-phosphate dependent enzyme, partial [Alphaproteobacteria bacterium]